MELDDFRIVMSYIWGSNTDDSESNSETHPASPGAEVLQRIRDNFHTFAHHSVDVDFLILVGDSGEKEDQTTSRSQQIPCEQH